jgi:hypothetical protein
VIDAALVLGSLRDAAALCAILGAAWWALDLLAAEIDRIQSARATLREFTARATNANRAGADTPTRPTTEGLHGEG